MLFIAILSIFVVVLYYRSNEFLLQICPTLIFVLFHSREAAVFYGLPFFFLNITIFLIQQSVDILRTKFLVDLLRPIHIVDRSELTHRLDMCLQPTW